MKFPKWVEPPRTNKATRASNRLRYLLKRIAIERNAEGSLKKMCHEIGIDHSSLACAVRRGYCSERQALLIQDLIGADHTPWRYLRYPLDIEVEKS